jgi:hypothetical protein
MKRGFGELDPQRRREIATRGGQAKAAKRRAARAPLEPYAEPFLAFLEATGRGGPSRTVWRVFWKAADGLPLTDPELDLFRLHTGRETAPTTPVRECWLPAGRRGGKSEQMVTRATWRAISRDWRSLLSAGEVGVIPLIASDREQARNSLAYLKGLMAHPLVKPYVAASVKDAVTFRTGAQVKVATASWRATRGYTMLDAILEECAFYQVEGSANPDEEILTAIRPALLTVPGSRIYGISSPYARRGILWKAYDRYWGRADADVLVFSADSLSLNPTLDQASIARAFEEDPQAAASEYGRDGLVAFRHDVEAFLDAVAVEAVVNRSRPVELGPREDVHYVGFTDASGGSQDSFTLGIAHLEGERAVLDCIRERRPPFSPDAVVEELAGVLKPYRIGTVTGDHYAGEFPRELFRKHGIDYRTADRTKSDFYRELLAPVNAGRVELPNHDRLKAQLVGLERRVSRTGKDSIDHSPGGRDDVANAAAGALVLALREGEGISIDGGAIAKANEDFNRPGISSLGSPWANVGRHLQSALLTPRSRFP